MQVLEQAVKATGSLDDGKLADYIHKNAFNTIVGEIRFDEKGEWAKPRLLMIQFQNVDGSNLDQYRTAGKQVILYPPEYKDGDLQQPFAKSEISSCEPRNRQCRSRPPSSAQGPGLSSSTPWSCANRGPTS